MRRRTRFCGAAARDMSQSRDGLRRAPPRSVRPRPIADCPETTRSSARRANRRGGGPRIALCGAPRGKESEGHGQDPENRHGCAGRAEGDVGAGRRVRRARRPRLDLDDRREGGRPAVPPARRGEQARHRARPAHRHRSASTSGRLSVGCKSPLTGGIKESNAGGQAAQALARLGYVADHPRGPAGGRRPLQDRHQQGRRPVREGEQPPDARQLRRPSTKLREGARRQGRVHDHRPGRGDEAPAPPRSPAPTRSCARRATAAAAASAR